MEIIDIIFKVQKSCPCCMNLLSIIINKETGFSLQCCHCSSFIHIYTNTSYYGFRVKPYLICLVNYYFYHQLNVSQIKHILKNKISKVSIIRLTKILKRKIHNYIENKRQFIRLNGTIELDETYLPKVKFFYRAGRRVRHNYIFGLFSREQKFPLLFTIPNRRAETILPIILTNINYGELIYSDCFSVYLDNRKTPKESNLAKFGYRHHWVNHSTQFVSFVDNEAHINNIEHVWSDLKSFFKSMKIKKNYAEGVSLYYFFKYIPENDRMEFMKNIF